MKLGFAHKSSLQSACSDYEVTKMSESVSSNNIFSFVWPFCGVFSSLENYSKCTCSNLWIALEPPQFLVSKWSLKIMYRSFTLPTLPLPPRLWYINHPLRTIQDPWRSLTPQIPIHQFGEQQQATTNQPTTAENRTWNQHEQFATSKKEQPAWNQHGCHGAPVSGDLLVATARQKLCSHAQRCVSYILILYIHTIYTYCTFYNIIWSTTMISMADPQRSPAEAGHGTALISSTPADCSSPPWRRHAPPAEIHGLQNLIHAAWC